MDCFFAGRFGERDKRREVTQQSLIQFLVQQRGFTLCDALEAGWAWTVREVMSAVRLERLKKETDARFSHNRLKRMTSGKPCKGCG